MDTFWLKAAGIGIAGLVLVLAGAQFFSGDRESAPAEDRKSITDTKSFASQIEEDRERLGAEPQPIDLPPAGEPSQGAPEAETASEPAELEESATPTIIYVTPLQEFETFAAEKLWNSALPGRSVGRLPGPGYNMATKACSEIIQRYPGSKYAFMAMRLLNDIPENRRGQAGNSVDIDISRFYQKRPGTQPMSVPNPDDR